MQQIGNVITAGGSYPVFCGDDAPTMLAQLWQPRWRQTAIIGDSNTLPLFGEALARVLRPRCQEVLQLAFTAGETHKTRETKQTLEDRLLEAGFDRSCCIVAVGGGIALDLAGFVAATYLRGVDHINVATSLLAQVDAAVGGKTAVNTAFGKNLIGAFHHPRAVLIDAAALGTLPESELRNGLAEAVKHAVLVDPELFEALEQWAAGLNQRMVPLPVELLARCVTIKAEVVARDEREQAYRQVLNFGHTVAHALETASGHAIAHGSAVAIGMVVEARIAETLCGFAPDQTIRLQRLLDRLGLPTRPTLPFAAARELLGHDKKTRAGVVHCALPQRIGAMCEADGHWALAVDPEQIQRAWDALYIPTED